MPGLAILFPGSSLVESDFSLLKMDIGSHPTSLESISIDVQFHARQCSAVERLEMRVGKRRFIYDMIDSVSG